MRDSNNEWMIRYLLLLDRLQDLDDTLLVGGSVDSFEHFAVFPAADFFDNFVIVLWTVIITIITIITTDNKLFGKKLLLQLLLLYTHIAKHCDWYSPPSDLQRLIVPVLFGLIRVHISVYTSTTWHYWFAVIDATAAIIAVVYVFVSYDIWKMAISIVLCASKIAVPGQWWW